MKKNFVLGLAVGLLSILNVDAAQAVSLRFTPESQTVNLGDNAVKVKVEIFELAVPGQYDNDLGGYNFRFEFDPNILRFAKVDFGDQLSNSLFPSIKDVQPLSSSLIDIFEVSLLTPDELIDLPQANNFTLATLTFNAIGLGTSDLRFQTFPLYLADANGIDLSDGNGNTLIPTLSDASVTVIQQVTTVPEPSNMLVSMGALTTLFVMQQLKKKKS
jgi:hypothetical protein